MKEASHLSELEVPIGGRIRAAFQGRMSPYRLHTHLGISVTM